jgi:hypothetical protein
MLESGWVFRSADHKNMPSSHSERTGANYLQEHDFLALKSAAFLSLDSALLSRALEKAYFLLPLTHHHVFPQSLAPTGQHPLA